MNSKSVLWIILKNLSFHNYLFLLQFLFFYNGILQAQWVQTNLPSDGIVNCLAVNGNNIYAGLQNYGFYLSTNNGLTWAQKNNDLTTSFITANTVSGTNVFVGTNYGVFRSTNNGTNWTGVNTGINSNHVNAFAVGGNNIFVGTDFSYGGTPGVFLSTNNGTNWTEINNGLPYSLHMCPLALAVSGTNIFAGLSESGVYLSINNGNNWKSVGPANITVKSLAIGGTNIFAGTDEGVFLSTNNGTNWTKVNEGLSNNYNFTLIVSGSNVFTGTEKGVFLSTNNGSSWTEANSGLIIVYIQALAICGTNIFAGTFGSGVWMRPLSELVGVSNDVNKFPRDFTLAQNYPNPFNPSTVISYSLPSASNIKLLVYNTLGQTVKLLENEFKQPGNYSVCFNASDLPSGIYCYKLEAGQFSQIKKMILIK